MKNKELKFEKVYENNRQRFYKLSQPVKKVKNPNYNFDEEKKYQLSRIKEEYHKYFTDSIEYVAVSDAKTHIERLLFLAIPFDREIEPFIALTHSLQIDGKLTMMSNGGDTRDVHPDEVYLKRLAQANNLIYGGVVKNNNYKDNKSN